MKFSRFFILLLFVLTLATSASATDYNVSTVSDLESKVNSASDDDTIIVASGDYKLTKTLTISKSITLKSSGTVTLDGQNARRVIKITGGSPTIEGFTIKNGKTEDATGDNGSSADGGGIEAKGDKLTVKNCRFENNKAVNNGGGIYISSSSSSYVSEIKNCTFINNQATASGNEGGGGIFVYNGSKVDITNCTFTGNTATNTKSGALCVATTDGGNANVTVNYCTFATDSDKITMNKSNNITVKNSIIRAIVAGYDANLSNVTSADNITITTALTSEDVKDKTGDVTHTVFRKESELLSAVDKGNDANVQIDQLGNSVTYSHDIGAVEIAVNHMHSFTYSANSATITATCNGTGICTLTDRKAILTIAAPANLAYDGTAKNASISGSIPGVSNPSIVYNLSEPVNAGTYTASITLGNATASVNFTITKRNATVTAKAQTLYVNGNINTGTGYAELSNALTGHSLSSVTLTASSTASATANGTITPSNAIIKDGSNNDVTANYDITYQTGTLTVTTKTVKELNVNFNSALTPALVVTQGNAKTAAYSATATATYSDSSTASLTPTLTLESDYNWITFNASTGIVTVAPTTSVSSGNYSVKIIASATADGVTQTAETTLTVTVVNASATITPKSLTFDKASITIDFDVDEGISVSDSVSVTVKDTNGNDITALGEIVCEKVTADFDELTSTVDGNKITFTVPAGTDPESKTVMFTVKFRYDGKDYLMTNYKVVVYRTRLGGYYLTLSPVEITVIPGRTASLDLKNSVKFEKVFQNNHTQTVKDAKMIFSLNTAVSWINCDSDSGVVTLNPGADVETGVLEYRYKVKAEYDGNSETEAADFKVNVVKKSPAITTETLPNATVNTPYSHTFMATGDDPITWSITNFESHPFPDWLTIDAGTGTISGTPASEGLFSFTVQASNAYGTDSCGFSIKVILKGVAPASWKYSLDPVAGHLLKPKQTFHFKRRVAKGENINYTYKEKGIPSGKYLKSVFEWDVYDGAVKEGASYIKFNLSYRGNTHDYVFMEGAITAKNDYGKSKSPEKTITVTKNEKNDNGKISPAVQGASDGLITLADDEDDGEELSGSMYFDDGGTDEDGNITGVIGGENAKFKTLADFINSLTEEQCAKVIRIEFRKGAEVSKITAADIEKLTGLLEIAVDESETLTEFNLNGNKTIESVSIFKCSALEKLDVKNCVALYHLEAAQCPKLTALDVEGCSSLEAIWLNGSSVTNLNLSGSDFANVADIDLTECNSLTSLNVDGCAALSNLYAPYTAVTELNLKNNPELTDVFLNETKVGTLDLSNNAKLKSLSLVGATELADLKLAEGVELEEFEVTGSKITELDYTGNDKITTLNLSGNTELKTLNLTDCASLKELTLTGTPIEKLTLSGCYSLEKIEAEGCSALTTLPLDKDNSNVREIYLSGSGLTALDVGACEKLTSLDVSGCTELASLNARGCSLKWLDVTACAKLAELDCSENQLGWLNLDGLTALSNVNYSGQEIYGWVADTRMKMSDYIGSNDIGRIADILAYGANEIGIETTLEDGDGNVYKADTEYYAVFKSVPEKVVYYYDTKFSGEPMDVTLIGKSSPTEIGGSGGGCDSIRNEKLEIRNHLILALFILALALLKKRRIKKM